MPSTWIFVILLGLVLPTWGINMALQGSSDCSSKRPLCLDPGLTVSTGSGIGLSNESSIPLNAEGGWGKCFSTDREVNSAWFYFKAKRSGYVEFALVSTHDVDFVLWGPFDSAGEGCGANLTYSKNLTCAWSRGPSTLANEGQLQNSLEKVKFNATAGKYYVLLVNDQTGNGTFYMDPRISNATDAFDCGFMTDVYNFTINGTGNVTSYGTMPVLGDPVTITFTGLILDSFPLHDQAKTVLPTDFCNGTNVGSDRVGNDLLPGDQSGLNQTQWSLYFLNGGTYKLCYRPYGFDWKELLPTFQVADGRDRPPVLPIQYVPDATDSDTVPWFDFEPKTVTRSGPVTFTFFGFKIQANTNISVKAVVESCQESRASVPGMIPQLLSSRNTVKFSLPLPGQYRICLMHRLVWEMAVNYVQVTTADSTAVFNGYSSCEQLLANNPSYCGCFFDNNKSGTLASLDVYGSMTFPAPVEVPVDFPMDRVLQSTNFPPINQGCCAHNTPVRSVVDHPTKLWGLCAETTAVTQPIQWL
eukprot:GGOE01019146.1.p1 GENE.GGOE01019146.1~~GGOE01019146.1.p1  ORF type:complete len:528 (-),score=93.99 GGOE01019146.1:165-1748(-)